jgi:hypothetical protein
MPGDPTTDAVYRFEPLEMQLSSRLPVTRRGSLGKFLISGGGGLIGMLLATWLFFLLGPAPGSPLVSETLQVQDLSNGRVVNLDFGKDARVFAVVSTRCVPCFRYFLDLMEMVSTLPGEGVLLAPNRSEAEFFLQFRPEMKAYAAVDERDFERVGFTHFPTVIHARGGRVRFALHGIPTRRQIFAARWVPLFRWRKLRESTDPGCTMASFLRMGEELSTQEGSP